jgi:hypothetical protein
MWMTDYIREIKRQFRDVYHFVPNGGTEADPTFAEGSIPDGEYPMTIEGRLDRVRLEDGAIKCGNFEPSKVGYMGDVAGAGCDPSTP